MQRKSPSLPSIWFDGDEHTCAAIALAKSIKKPELVTSRSAFLWLYLVAQLLESLHSEQKWLFQTVTHAPNADDDGFAATIVFSCKGISVTAEFGIFRSRDIVSVWMAIDNLGRVVEFEEVPIAFMLRGFTQEMKLRIYERQLELAWMAGNPESARTRSRNAWVDWDDEEVAMELAQGTKAEANERSTLR